MQIIPASNIACPWRVKTVELCTCWLAKGINLIANFLKPRLAQSHTTVVIPLYKRVVFIRLLNCSEFSSRLSKISQALDAIAGTAFMTLGYRSAQTSYRLHSEKQQKSEPHCLISSADLLTLFVFDGPTLRPRQRGTVDMRDATLRRLVRTVQNCSICSI